MIWIDGILTEVGGINGPLDGAWLLTADPGGVTPPLVTADDCDVGAGVVTGVGVLGIFIFGIGNCAVANGVEMARAASKMISVDLVVILITTTPFPFQFRALCRTNKTGRPPIRFRLSPSFRYVRGRP